MPVVVMAAYLLARSLASANLVMSKSS